MLKLSADCCSSACRQASRNALEVELRSRIEAAEGRAQQLEETALQQSQLLDQATAALELEKLRGSEERAQAQERIDLLLEGRRDSQAAVDGLRQAVEAAKEAAEAERVQAEARHDALCRAKADAEARSQALQDQLDALQDERGRHDAAIEGLLSEKEVGLCAL